MFNLLFKSKKEIDSIINSFPSNLRSDVIVVTKILPFSDKRITLSDGSKFKMDGSLISDSFQALTFKGEAIRIPTRVYFNEPDVEKEEALSEKQKVILNCVYLCNSNGFIREKRLKDLIGSNDDFAIPFILKLLGEYVIEILNTLDEVVTTENISEYREFISENPGYWIKTKSRVVSYWNEYYRRNSYPDLKNYPGQKIVDRINRV